MSNRTMLTGTRLLHDIVILFIARSPSKRRSQDRGDNVMRYRLDLEGNAIDRQPLAGLRNVSQPLGDQAGYSH
jgi:hypothetical protein